jgi:hypothetical protein
VCGPLSTEIQAPQVLPNTEGLEYYLMDHPEIFYTLDLFTNSNPQCPIESVTLEPIIGGSESDFDGVQITVSPSGI